MSKVTAFKSRPSPLFARKGQGKLKALTNYSLHPHRRKCTDEELFGQDSHFHEVEKYRKGEKNKTTHFLTLTVSRKENVNHKIFFSLFTETGTGIPFPFPSTLLPLGLLFQQLDTSALNSLQISTNMQLLQSN